MPKAERDRLIRELVDTTKYVNEKGEIYDPEVLPPDPDPDDDD